MQQLDPEKLQLEIISFSMNLQQAFQNGEAYITIHRDVAQGLINKETDMAGTLMALEDRIHDLEIETEAATKTIEHLRNQNPRKEVIMNDAPETTGEQGNEIIGVPMPELNDAIDLGLHQLRQAIEVGKSIARREVVIDIDAAEFLLGVVAACSSPEEDDADFAEVDESDGDLTAEIGDLNDVVASLENNIEGHISKSWIRSSRAD